MLLSGQVNQLKLKLHIQNGSAACVVLQKLNHCSSSELLRRVSVRVSNELGSGRPRAAMHAVIVVIAESLLIGLICMALVLIFRDYFAIIYTNDVELQHAVSKIAGLLGLTMVLNSVQPVVSGMLFFFQFP